MFVHVCAEVKMDGRPDIIWSDLYVSVSVVSAVEGPKEAILSSFAKRTTLLITVNLFDLIIQPNILAFLELDLFISIWIQFLNMDALVSFKHSACLHLRIFCLF